MADAYYQSGSSPVGQLANGDRLGAYVVSSLIDTSSFATAYAGSDPILNRQVLIEQIHLTGSSEDEQIRQRVKDTAGKVRQITTANAKTWAPVLEVIDEPRGLFIVTERVGGQTLAQTMQQNPLPMPVREAMGLVAAIAAALKPLHAAKLTHRDLEPANVLLPGENAVRLTHAGIVAAADPQYALNAPTAAYMAPEILRGEDIDRRADLYSLGMIAYRLMAGEEKFNDAFKVVVRDQRNEAMRWMKWHTNPRIAAPPLHELLPPRDADDALAGGGSKTSGGGGSGAGVSESISAVVARLMQKSPSARFDSVDDLLDAIRRQFSQSATARAERQAAAGVSALDATPLSTPGHTAPLPRRRNPLPMVLAVMLGTWVVLACVIGGIMLNRSRNAANETYEATVQTLEQAKDAREAGQFADASRLFQDVADRYPLDTRFGKLGRAGMLRSEADGQMAAKDFMTARNSYRNLEKMQVYPTTDVRQWIARAEENAAFSSGMSSIRAAIESGNYDQARELLTTWDELVDDWAILTQSDAEVQQLAEMQQLLRQRLASETIDQLLTRARTLWESGRRNAAISSLELAIESKPGTPELEALHNQYQTQERYDALIRQADASRNTGKAGDAVQAYRDAIRIAEANRSQPWFQSQPQTEQKVREAQMEQAFIEGNALMESGQFDQARTQLQKSVDIARSLGLDPNGTPAMRALNKLASTAKVDDLITQGQDAMTGRRYSEAVTLFQQAMAIEPRDAVAQQLDDARFSLALQTGLSLLEEAKFEQAEQRLQRAAQLRPDDSSVARALSELQLKRNYAKAMTDAQVALETKRYGDAKRAVAKAEDLAKNSDGVLDVRSITEFKNQIEYEHLIAQAIGYYENKQYRLSWAQLRAAMDLRDTEEAHALLKQLEPYLVGIIDETPQRTRNIPLPGDDGGAGSKNDGGSSLDEGF